jgi:NAD(P)H-nitrite reductase large subunit
MIATSTERVLCHCLRVTEQQVNEAIECQSLCTLREVMRATGAGRGCMSCHSRIKALLTGEPLPAPFVVPQCDGCTNPACGCEASASVSSANQMSALGAAS